MASPKQQHQHQHRKRKGGGGARPLVLRRAMLHSCLCFVVGLVTGLAPSDWADAASRAAAANAQVLSTRAARAMNHTAALLTTHYQLRYYQPEAEQTKRKQQQEEQQVLVVVTTTTTTAQAPHQPDRERRSAGLTRTAHALRLVSPPLVVVWLVVEPAREAPPTAALLRRTGLVYRHLTYADNFTSCDEERHHQRNVALAHVEQHRLRGVLLFAGLADVYDLRLLDNLRHIRTLGAWPVATVWEQEGRVAVQGPLCTSSGNSSNTSVSVSAWFSAPTFSTSTTSTSSSRMPAPDSSSLDADAAGFAFASDLLWDPARWDRFPTSEPDHSQDSIDFLHRLLLQDYNKTRPIPDYSTCSHIMAWRVDTTLL
ncbi:unnamed protein product [Urochloa humidicola]